MEQNGRYVRVRYIMEYGLLNVLLLYGMLQEYFVLVELVPEEKNGLYMTALLITAVCAALSSYAVPVQYAVGIPILCAAVLTLCIPAGVMRGMAGMVNALIRWWNIRFEDAVRLLPAEPASGAESLDFALVWICLNSAWCWYLIQKHRQKQAGILLTVLILTGAVLGRCSVLACVFLIVYKLVCMNLQSRRTITVRSGVWIAGAGMILLVLAALTGETTVPQITLMKNQCAVWLEQLRYGADTLPEGDLRKSVSMEASEGTALRVTSGERKDLYLRGFVGACYENGRWTPLKRAAFGGEQTGQVRWLKKQEFCSADQYAAYQSAGGVAAGNPITVDNIGADREYVYLPYSADRPEQNGIDQKRDGGFRSTGLFGERSYSCMEYAGNLPPELLTLDAWTEDPDNEEQLKFLQKERVYAAFVRENYLSVDRELEPWIQMLFFDGEELSGQSICAVTTVIRKKLETMVSYNSKIASLPEHIDPILWFLQESREGNAALYASAAVQAFRVCGIPARYVEGYVLRGQMMEPDSRKPAELGTEAAHAWAEVYMDGIGWVPIDVTPGYYYDTYALMELLKASRGITKTAAVQESVQDGIPVLDDENSGHPSTEPEPEIVEHHYIRWVVLWISLAVLSAAAAEIIRALRLLYGWYRIRHAKDQERAERLCAGVLNGLQAAGIDAQPGWKTEETEQQLMQTMPGFSEGEYQQVSRIIMKFAYGKQLPEPWEEGVLLRFLDRLYSQAHQLSWRQKLRFRYHG